MLWELKNVLLMIYVDLRIHHIIDIVIAEIPESYGMWLSRFWSEKLKGYFATDWSHLWLPYNGKPNQINIVREPYMKQIVTHLNDPSEPTFYFSSCIEHYTFDSFFSGIFLLILPMLRILEIYLKSTIIFLFHLLVLLFIMYIM